MFKHLKHALVTALHRSTTDVDHATLHNKKTRTRHALLYSRVCALEIIYSQCHQR